MADRDHDVLLSIETIGHWIAVPRRAQRRRPSYASVTCVDRIKRVAAARDEHQSAARCDASRRTCDAERREFEPAQRLLDWGRERLRDWTEWLRPKPLWVKGLVGLATLALVLAFFWGLFALSGVPGWFPDFAETMLVQLPGLGR